MPTRMPISLRDRGVEADLPLYLSFAPQEVPAHRLARPLGVARLHPPEDRGHRAGAHRRCGRLIRSSYNSQLSITVALWLVKRRRRGAETGRSRACVCENAIAAVETVRLRTLHVLFFIEVQTRRVFVAGCTEHPTVARVTRQARNLLR